MSEAHTPDAGSPGSGRHDARAAGPQRRRSRAGAFCYFVIAIAGLIGTWTFNLRFALIDGGGNYVGSWFANNAASSAAVDLIVMTTAAAIFYWRERWVIPGRIPWSLLFIPLSLVVAVSFAFPLFLGIRELALARRQAAAQAAAQLGGDGNVLGR